MNIPLSRNSSYPKKLKLRVHNSIFLVCIFPSVRQIFHLGSAPFGLVCLPQTADCHGWLVSGSLVRPLCSHHHQLSNQFWSGFIPVNGGGQIYPSSNLFNSHSPSRSILQTNALALLLHLRLPRLLWSSWLPLAPHFKLQCFSQNVPIIPPQHMPWINNNINNYHYHLKWPGIVENLIGKRKQIMCLRFTELWFWFYKEVRAKVSEWSGVK